MEEYTQLSNGVEIPKLGFGVFQITDYDECKQAVLDALSDGIRLIDTAEAYFNEKAVGDAIKESKIPREEIFITTKIWITDYGYENTKKAFKESCEKLGTDYIDLYLIHQNIGDVYGTWRAMEELYEEDKIKAIGISNFTKARLYDFCVHNKIKPMVLQIEVNPFYQQDDMVEYCKNMDIKVEAWSPLAEGRNNIFQNPVLTEIGDKYNKSVAQVIIRWLIQRDIIVFPKSVHPERIKENADVFDFELSDEDMKKIATLDMGEGSVDLDSYDFVKMINSYTD